MKTSNPIYSEAMPHQKEAIDFLVEKKRGILVHDMGLGKTFSSIRAACALGARNALVICPAIARRNWAREIEQWAPGVWPRIEVVEKTNTQVHSRGVTIISYDLAAKATSHYFLKEVDWDVLIIDEAHYLKNKKAKRTWAMYGRHISKGGLVEKADAVFLLTGTIAPNHVGELWTHLHRLFPDTIRTRRANAEAPMSHFQFMSRYCDMYQNAYGWQVKGNNRENIKELTKRVKPIIHRRKKDLLDLPPLRVTNYYLPPGKASRAMKEFEKSEEGRALLAVLQDASRNERGGTVITALATLRRLTSLAKADAVIDLAVEAIEEGTKKLVLFAHHRSCIKRIHEGLTAKKIKASIIYGGMSNTARQWEIDNFQSGETQVIIGQLQAASTAINLHAASDVWLVESDWVPGNNLQAINRCHRIGQRNAVLARVITLAGSIDEVVQETIVRKTAGLVEAGL